MTELERRAMLGDRKAQEEATRQGIVLPCPKCFKPVKVHGPEDWEPKFHDPDSGGDPYEFDCECGLAFSTYKYDFKEALSDWNTRPSSADWKVRGMQAFSVVKFKDKWHALVQEISFRSKPK